MTDSVCLICPDEFGVAVADALQPRLGGRAVRHDGGVAGGHLPIAACYVVVAGRPLPAELDALDTAAFAWRCRLVAVTVEHPYLRLGPVVVPGAGACYHCYAARLQQHSPTPEYAEAVRTHFRAPDARSFPGYLPPLASFVAGWLDRTLAALERDAGSLAGRVQQLHLLNLHLLDGRVVGVHGCRRCGLGRDERRRSVDELEPLARELAGVAE